MPTASRALELKEGKLLSLQVKSEESDKERPRNFGVSTDLKRLAMESLLCWLQSLICSRYELHIVLSTHLGI